MHGRAIPFPTRRFSESATWRTLASTCGALLALLTVLTPSPTRALVLIALLLGDKVSNERFQLGLNVSFAANGLWGVSHNPRPTWSMSLYGEIALSERFRLQPEIGLRYPGGARNMHPGIPGYSIEALDDPIYDDVALDGSVERDLRYISLPVFAKVIVNPIAFGLGPQLAILHGAHDRVSKSVAGTKVTLEDSIESVLQRVDFGFAGSVEYAFMSHRAMRSFRVRARGYLGLVDTVKSNPDKAVRNWSFLLGVDIPVGGGKPKSDAPRAPSEEKAGAPSNAS